MVTFIFTFAANVPLYAQEEKEEEETEDIEDFSLEELLDVEITTAGKQVQKISDVPASVVVVTRDEIERYGYQTLTEVLESIPGLYSINDWWDGPGIGVRGFWKTVANNNLIILVNGVAQMNDIQFNYPLTKIPVPVEAIDRIEVIRGPMSVIYGTGAFLGVINIFTNEIPEEKGSMVSASFGSEKTAKLFARVSGRSGDLNYSFNASYYDTEGISVDLADLGAAPGSPTEGLLEDHEKYFNFSGTFKGFSFDLSYAESQLENMFVLPSVTEGTDTLLNATSIRLGYNKELSEKVTLNAKLSYFQTKKWWKYDYLFPGFFGNQEMGSNAYKAELTMFFRPVEDLNITLGIDYYSILDVYNMFNLPLFGLANVHNYLAADSNITTRAVFTQLNYKLSEKLKLVAGVRLEQMQKWSYEGVFLGGAANQVSVGGTYDKEDVEFIPRVAVIYYLSENHIFKFLFGKALIRPSYFESTDSFTSRIYPLDPETILTYELNYIAYLSSGITANLSLFRNELDNLIVRTTEFVNGVFIEDKDNAGQLVTNGVELSLIIKPSPTFQMELSGTYQDVKDEVNTELDVAYAPKLLGYVKASYAFTKDITLAMTGTYVDKMLPLYDETIANPDGTFGARIGQEVDSYFLLGANLRFRNLFGKGMFFNIRGSNLLDKDIFYPTTSNNNWTPVGTKGKGLSFLATLGWKF